MSKPKLVISCPITTRSGYGAHARDIVKSLRDMGMFDVKIISQRWGNTPMTALDVVNDEFHRWIVENTIQTLTEQPDVWIQVTVPNEFRPIGKYNIGITAGIETTAVHQDWIQGMNLMDINIVPSKFSKDVFDNTIYDQKNANGEIVAQVKTEKPIHILFEGYDESVYNYDSPNSKLDMLSHIKENWAFLFVGHWLQGEQGHDRKDVGTLIDVYCNTFRNTSNPPALLLKTSSATTSIMDRELMLRKIRHARGSVGASLPIYLIHGDFTDAEMWDLYTNPKVKSMVSFTKGEGFGRPLLEFSLTGKPIIASNFSGHLDFLQADKTLLVGGELQNVHPSAIIDKVIINESKWFYVNKSEAKTAMKELYKNYKKYLKNSKEQASFNKKNFSLKEMGIQFKRILDENLPEFKTEVMLKLPDLPKLKKVK